MRNHGFILLPALLLSSIAASAQDVREAYNFSSLTVQGTASSMGYGNALGSLGGDFSSVDVNPAGLGFYKSSELTFTPSLRINGTSSDYAGTTTPDNNTHFNINNFGLIFTHAPKPGSKRYEHHNWKSVSFAIGMNRVADFNSEYTYQGKNNTSSASQAFESDANQNTTNALSTTQNNSLGYMGYNSFLLNQDPVSGSFYTTVPFAGGIDQLKSVQESGGIDEYTISLAANYREKLMIGATLGLSNLNYQRSSNYSETLDPANSSSNPYGFSSFNYNQQLNIIGAGIDAKIGAIYKITDFFRIGVAFHSPTFYTIHDNSRTSLFVNNDSTSGLAGYNGVSSRNDFDYNLSTPWKGVLSATFILKRLGFITADYEYVDYSSMRYQYGGGIDYTTGSSYQSEADAINQTIQKTYQGVSDFRIGAGFNVAKILILRVGAGYYGNAYTAYGEANELNYTTQRIDLNAGLGLHFKHFFTDLGFVHSMYQGVDQPYSIDYSGVVTGSQAAIPQAKVNYSINNLALTMGVRF